MPTFFVIQTVSLAGKFSGCEQQNQYVMNGYRSNVSTVAQLAVLAETVKMICYFEKNNFCLPLYINVV